MSVSFSMRAHLALALLLAAAEPVHAGDCTSGGPDVLRQMDLYARGKLKQAPQLDHLCVEQGVMYDPKLVKKFLASCATILKRDHTDMNCTWWGIEMGQKSIGGVDLFEGLSGWVIEPFEYGNLASELLVELDDPRGVALVRAAWEKANADKRATSSKKEPAHNFLVFRHFAIKLMAKHGSADDATFLRAELAKAKDRGLKRALTRAIAAIDKRAKASTAAPPKTP